MTILYLLKLKITRNFVIRLINKYQSQHNYKIKNFSSIKFLN